MKQKTIRQMERLRRILREYCDEEATEAVLQSRLRLDRANVLVADHLSAANLKALFGRRHCAIHIRGFCEPAIAGTAAKRLLASSNVIPWYLASKTGRVRTDMNYGVGIPRQIAGTSKKAARDYRRTALTSIRTVRAAFAPHLSPLDRLRLETAELFRGGAPIQPFHEHPGLVGLMRIMQPKSLFAGVAGKKGACHVDSDTRNRVFSSNIYLSVPRGGGELRIWNIALDDETARTPLYSLLAHHNPFFEDMQDVFHTLLPEPIIIRPRTGDMIILDSSRPHAVAGFKSGSRVSIQTFMMFNEHLQQVTLKS